MYLGKMGWGEEGGEMGGVGEMGEGATTMHVL